MPVPKELPGPHGIQLQQQIRRRRLTRARRSRQYRNLARLRLQIQPPQDIPPSHITEMNIPEFHRTVARRNWLTRHLRPFRMQQRHSPLPRRRMVLHPHRNLVQRIHRAVQLIQVRHEHHHIPRRQLSPQHQPPAMSQHQKQDKITRYGPQHAAERHQLKHAPHEQQQKGQRLLRERSDVIRNPLVRVIHLQSGKQVIESVVPQIPIQKGMSQPPSRAASAEVNSPA